VGLLCEHFDQTAALNCPPEPIILNVEDLTVRKTTVADLRHFYLNEEHFSKTHSVHATLLREKRVFLHSSVCIEVSGYI